MTGVQTCALPISQWGSNHLLPPSTNRPVLRPRATLRVLAGDPVDLEDLRGGRVRRSALHEATDRIMARITEQLGVLRGETPPAPPTHGDDAAPRPTSEDSTTA